MIRFGQITRLRPEKAQEYRAMHAAAWPEVLATITACGIENYSIFVHDDLLFAYFEYTGRDWEAAKQRMAADPVTQEWWRLTDPCQASVLDDDGGPWTEMEEIFHHD